jgi:hypothetical protein
MKPNIIHQLKKYAPYLLKAQEENLTEADTVQRIIKIFENVLGYDALSEITQEMEIKSKFVDLTIKIDGMIKFFVEVKRAGTKLRDRHVEQGEKYAAEGNIQWILLTNGVEWKLFHLTFDEGIDYEIVFSTDLATDSIEKVADLLGLLHRHAIKTGEHEEFWKQCAALNATSIGKALFSEDVLLFVRRKIRRHEGTLITVEDLAEAIYSLFIEEAKVQIGPLKIRSKRSTKRSSIKNKDTHTATPDSEQAKSVSQPSDQQNISPNV